MKRITFILALSTMLVLGSCGSKSTTNEGTDVEVVDSTSVVESEDTTSVSEGVVETQDTTAIQ
jgi:hypothetical protein